jgi:Carboxypeptidase regulatory-like domain
MRFSRLSLHTPFRMSSVLLTAGLLAFIGAPLALAQVTTAAIHGTVTDPSGSVVPGASITALDTQTGISTVTTSNQSGYYIIPQLQVGGPYTITVSAPNFAGYSTSGIVLTANGNREVDAKLKVGATAQTIEVTANAVQVDTSNTQLEQVATAAQLENIPLEGRDPEGLQKLMPGVVESSDRFGSYSSNGNQTTNNSYVLDGTDINDGPLQNEGIEINPDALQEENMVTSTMNPEFSRNSGAVINQVIKSGTNRFHGNGFEFYRDTFLNNGNYFSQVRPVFHQNLYGGTLGGPVFKNKLFFFAAFQGLRNRTGQTTTASTLDSDQFAGQFSSDSNYVTGNDNNTSYVVSNTPGDPNYCANVPAGTYSDSLTCNPTPFAIGSIPAGTPWIEAFNNGSGGTSNISIPNNEWDSVASNLIKNYVPPANNGADLYTFNANNLDASDQGIIRADYKIGPNDSIWASSVVQSSPSSNDLSFGGGSFPGFGQHASEHFKIFSADYTHTFNLNMLNDLHGGYYRLNYPSVIPTPVQLPSALGFSINPQLAQSGIPYISIGNYFSLGNSYEGPQPRTDTNLTYADNFTWVHGNHTLKFGASYEQFRVHNPFGYLNNGYYSYDGGGVYSSGDPLIDFALGIPDSFEQANDGFVDAVASETYAYGQDNWKVTPDLTFNYGLGWDIEQPNQNLQFGGLGIVCFALGNTTSNVYPGGPPGLTYNGDSGCNKAGGVPTRYNHFAPRIGFAWSPTSGPSAIIGGQGEHNFSIRGGFGLYFNRDAEEQSLQNLVDPPAFYISYGAADFGGSPAFANPYDDVAGNGSESNPFPFTVPAAGQAVDWSIYSELGVAAFDHSYSVPYTYNFNLNIQRSIGANLIAQVGYVGSLSHRLPTWYEGDPITSAGHAACLADPVCSAHPSLIHLYFPQYTAQPATVPGSGGIPWYTSIGMQNTEGSANYNSLQVSLIQHPTHGLQFTLAYTYGHSLDDGSGYESQTGGDTSYGNDNHVYNYVPGFKYLNYGNSDFDARQRLALSYVYAVPVAGFLKGNAFLRMALAGWGISGETFLQSGFPISINQGTDRSYWCDAFSYFGCADVPETSSFNIKTYNPRSSSTNQYFDTSSFSNEPLGTFGNVGRNFFHGPGFNYTNLSIVKNIHFSSESARYVQLRLEGFNAFNHANFAPPSGTLTNPTFGQVTAVDDSADGNGDPSPGRSVQLAGKFYF